MELDEFINESSKLCDTITPYFIKEFNDDYYLVTKDQKIIICLTRVGNA